MQVKCPYCFSTLGPTLAFVCSSCPPVNDPLASQYRGMPVVQPPIVTAPAPAEGTRDSRPTGLRCPTCNAVAHRAACPSCHAALPPAWFEASTTCIALAGTRYSGKSVYIGVVVKQLALMATMLGGVLQAVTGDTQRNYDELYEKALFVERGLIPSTPRQNPGDATYRHNTPLIYRLTDSSGRPHVIVLRDVAGENLADAELDPLLFSFLRRADGIVYLVDPLQITRIRNQVRGFLPLVQHDVSDPVPVLGNVVRLFTADPNKPAQSVRMALTLSKFDALQSLSEIPESSLYDAMRNYGAAYLRDPSLLDAAFHSADSDLLNLEIASLLMELDVVELPNLARGTFREWRWFAVSALGHQPATRLGDAGITPFRCLDPVKWILAGNGALEAR